MRVVIGQERIEPKGTDRILLVQLGYIGDVVVTMPVVRALRANFPKSRVVVLVRDHARELIEDCPWADGVLSVHKKKDRRWRGEIKYQGSFLRALRSHDFDLVINVRTGTRGAFYSFLSGASCRIGHYCYRHPWSNRLYTHVVQPAQWEGLYATEQNLQVLAPLNLDIRERIPLLTVPPEKTERALNLLRKRKVPLERPLIALHPCSSREDKNWEVDLFAALVDLITTKYDFPIVVTGSSMDRAFVRKITGRGNPKVFDLAGSTSIGGLVAVLQASRIFIGVDTGPTHIAAAVGTPTIAIFGSSDPAIWKPRGEQHEVIRKESSSAPYRRDGCQRGHRPSGSAQLSVEEVWDRVDKRLEQIHQAGPT